ncbi:hypothetical protein B0H14DRAFT_2581216 [Mycena olivaceomarginata]|nr:hypothetical protein B0H14DRAFT_2581216 [Mycena olivaceomarginata]
MTSDPEISCAGYWQDLERELVLELFRPYLGTSMVVPSFLSISGAGFSEMIIVQANGVDVRRLVWTATNSALELRLSQDLKSSRSWRVAFGDCGGSSRVGHRRFFLSGAHVLNGVIDRNKTWSFLYQFAGRAQKKGLYTTFEFMQKCDLRGSLRANRVVPSRVGDANQMFKRGFIVRGETKSNLYIDEAGTIGFECVKHERPKMDSN